MVLLPGCQCCEAASCFQPVPQKIIINIENRSSVSQYQSWTQGIYGVTEDPIEWTCSTAIFPVDYGGEYELLRRPNPVFPPATAAFGYYSSKLHLYVEMNDRLNIKHVLFNLQLTAFSRIAYTIVPGLESFTPGELFALPDCNSGEVRIPDIRNTREDINIYPICGIGYFPNAVVYATHFCDGFDSGEQYYSARFLQNSNPNGRWGTPPFPYALGDPVPLFPYRINYSTQLAMPISPSSYTVPVATIPYLSYPAHTDEVFVTSFDITRVRYVYADSVVDLPFT